MASSNGGVPPGFRFHPTDEELLHYYLRKKISFQKFDLEVIREVDLNKIEPWDLQERCRIGSTPQNEWYFFSHKDRKYPTGSRTNRATSAGFWKATGRDKCIRNSFKKIGMRKTLVFYRGRAPHGQKTDWIMHEYRLEDNDDYQNNSGSEDGWVVCRVFKKKNLFKIGGGSEGGTSMQGPTTHQLMNNASSNNQARALLTRDTHTQYVNRVMNQHTFDLYKPELGLQYSNNINHPADTGGIHYSSLQPQTLMLQAHNNKPIGYDPQLLSNQRDNCDSGSESLAAGGQVQYEQQGAALDHQSQQMVGERDEGLNDWTMLNGLVTPHQLGHEDSSSKPVVRFEDSTNASSVNQINQQLSIRGEMDFWGYAK
ncbi:hypothetical protein AQUCO_01400032v1 [Aquilegia coerulea]|uniref:NAC domain-containing protein n=1 Tax=Aquilegia coerulea TaxID=218851 RepID=A0A2G5DU51_AQUCA|nr:hypothetical protein AQUCO_01400032v1 [Aquilegia coerulea]